jgi:RHS repeat-associated protein
VQGGSEPGFWQYDYNAANQLVSWRKLAGPWGTLLKEATLGYDANGNRSEQRVTDVATLTAAVTQYSWDAQDRLSAVEMPDGQVHGYEYDYRTRRMGISRAGGQQGGVGTVTAVVFSGGLSLAEWETTGNSEPGTENPPSVHYTRGPDMGGGVGGLLYSRRGETLKYNLGNGRGDVVAQSNTQGELTWTASYEAYGKRTKETGENADKQRANTKDEDPTGLLNEGFRYRDLETGVWLSRDPAGFVDGPNLYAYVKQNPWSGFDPLGLAEEKAERLPSRNYGFFEGEPGNSRFIIDQKTQPDLAKKYPNGVDFKKGRPDFSPMKPGSISAKGVKLQTEYEIKLTGDTGADTAQARSQMIKQVREELKVSYKEADKIVRESLKDFRLHHHLDTNKIIVVPQDVHAVGHYGERAASAARMGKVKGGIGKALAGIAILQWLDPGQALAGPLGATTMGDATVSGAIERGLPQNDVSPGERLQFLQFSRGYLGGDKAASDSFNLWNSAGYEQELQHRESLQPK